MAHDEGHRLTDRRLAALEKRIARLYREASEELQSEIEAYFAAFESRDARQKALLEEGEITPEQYKQWRLNQMGRGRRFEALRDRLAQRYTQANEVAVAYVNDETPGIYTLNRNYAAYTIEQAGGGVDFTLWDEQTVKRLMVEDPSLMPYYPPERAVKRGIDLAYGKQVITRQVTGGILQGESIGKIADRLQANLPAMERASALRTARTAVTGAQNAGRMESYAAAEKMGIKLQREWVATLDNRTRHSHAMVDGERRALGAYFSNGCRFPGDPQGPAHEVYNCRCTLAAVVAGVDTSGAQRRARDPVTGESVLIPDMTYAQWEAWKRSENMLAWETYKRKGRNASADQKQYREYKAILGKSAPSSFADFQDMKYNDPDKWAYTKGLAGYIRKYPTSSKRHYDVSVKLKEMGVKKGVFLPPVQKNAYILPEGNRDPYHIMHRMAERSITDDDLRGYIKSARGMFVQWGGRRQLFVGNSGMCVVTKNGEDWLFKTGWDKSDFDEEMDTILEVLNDVGL